MAEEEAQIASMPRGPAREAAEKALTTQKEILAAEQEAASIAAMPEGPEKEAAKASNASKKAELMEAQIMEQAIDVVMMPHDTHPPFCLGTAQRLD